MKITVQFYSYFKDLTGCAETIETVPGKTTIAEMHTHLIEKFPKLRTMRNSTLIAVGVEYQPKDFVLKDGDVVSLFPPVQGG